MESSIVVSSRCSKLLGLRIFQILDLWIRSAICMSLHLCVYPLYVCMCIYVHSIYIHKCTCCIISHTIGNVHVTVYTLYVDICYMLCNVYRIAMKHTDINKAWHRCHGV